MVGMDLNAHAAGLNFDFVEGEPTDYLFHLTDWAGKETIPLGVGMLSGTVAGIRGDERWDIEVEDLPTIDKKVITFPSDLKPGRYVYEIWGEWSDAGRQRLVTGAITVEASVQKKWADVARPPQGKREMNVRVSAGQEGTIKAYVVINGFVASRAEMAEAAAERAEGSATEAKASEIVAKAAEAVAEKCRDIVQEAQEEVRGLSARAEAAAEAAGASEEAAAGSAADAARDAEGAHPPSRSPQPEIPRLPQDA